MEENIIQIIAKRGPYIMPVKPVKSELRGGGKDQRVVEPN
jgi:hypothetical protein